MEISKAQWQAVTHDKGACLLLAGPGSGKTFTIIQRLLFLIHERKVNPANILVITFTKAAALEMQERFRRETKKHILPVHFGTFHAVFYQILKSSGIYRNHTLITERKKCEIMKQVLTALGLKEEISEQDAVKIVGLWKNTGKIEALESVVEAERMKTVLEKYEQEMQLSGFLDFDDMILFCKKLLEEHPLERKKWSELFQYILIDEFQDINPLQYEVIQLLLNHENNIFAVGDDDQSIYGFRGSDPTLMQKFLVDYKDCRCLFLNVNYRCSGEIVEASKKCIEANKNRIKKEICAFRSGNDEAGKKQTNKSCIDKGVQVQSFQERGQEYQFVAKKIQSFHEEGIPWEEIAVIFRTNQEAAVFWKMMQQYSIPFQIKEKRAALENHVFVKDILAYLDLAFGKESRSRWLQIINHPNRNIPRFCLEKEGTRNELSIEVKRQLDKLKRDLKFMTNVSPVLFLKYLNKGIGYERFRKQEEAKEKGFECEGVMEYIEYVAKESNNLREFRDMLAGAESVEVDAAERAETKRTATENKHGVSILTMHGSKGLEFQAVFLPDLNEGVIPHGRLLVEEQIEEERRMLYVAMTRAKERLVLTYLTGNREHPKEKSRFLFFLN